MFNQFNLPPLNERVKKLLKDTKALNPENFNISKTFNEFALKIFWVITQKQFNLLNSYVKWDLINNHKLKREAQKIGIRLLRILENSEKYKIKIDFDKENIVNKNPWLALEYFIVEIVSRLHNYNWIKIEKWPAELEPNKIDFVLTKDRIKYWIQLTTVESSEIYKKTGDITALCWYCNSWELDKVLKWKISSQFIPDVPILMVVNSYISRLTNHNWILGIAYSKWKENWYNKTPTYYISNKHAREELYQIWLSLPNMISEWVKFIKANYSDQKIKEQRIWNLWFYFDWKDNLKISYYSQNPNDKNVQEFIYSIEIFITKKLLRKLWITPILRINWNSNKNSRNRRKK